MINKINRILNKKKRRFIEQRTQRKDWLGKKRKRMNINTVGTGPRACPITITIEDLSRRERGERREGLV